MICNNVPDRYIGISKDTVGAKIAAGATGAIVVASEDAATGGGMSFGKPFPLRPAEIEMLKKRN